MKKFQKNIKPGMSQNTRPPPPPTHTFPRFPKLQFKQAMFTCFSLQNPRYHWKGEGEVRISVCKCLKQERELLSHCSQLKWITKPLQGIKMDMLFKRHYHPPVLSKQVPRFYTIFFQLLAKNVSFLKTTDSRYRTLPLLEKKQRKEDPTKASLSCSSPRPRTRSSARSVRTLPFLHCFEGRKKRHPRLKPLIFSSNWFLPFCCNLSEKLKRISFVYFTMGHRGWLVVQRQALQKLNYQMATLLFLSSPKFYGFTFTLQTVMDIFYTFCQ